MSQFTTDFKLERAKSVLVPVSNPETATRLLELATALADTKTGSVVAVKIVVEEDDSAGIVDRLEQLRPQVDTLNQRKNVNVIELVTQIAPNITRGILDATREYQADLLIMGVQQHTGEVRLGHLVENIVQAAACDVLVYRMAEHTASMYNRILVPLNGGEDTNQALLKAVAIADEIGASLITLPIQRAIAGSTGSDDKARAMLSVLPDDSWEQTVITGADPVTKIVKMMEPSDLLVLGFDHQKDVVFEDEPGQEPELDDEFLRGLLHRAPGSVLLASVIDRPDDRLHRLRQRVALSLNPMVTQIERDEMVWQAQKTANGGLDFLVMILLSALLAALGLLLDSVAVIIGAMLVAPLMSPLASLSVGLVAGLLPITRRAAGTLVQGVLLALATSIVAGVLLPIDLPTQEMMARGNPTLIDAGVAIVSGLVAGYATARRGIPAAIAGVAIAAALMPPLVTVGLALGLGETALALGSMLLFTTNIIFIVMAEATVFLWIGMRPGRREDRRLPAEFWWAVMAVMGAFVSGVLITLSQQAISEVDIAAFLRTRFPDAEIADVSVERGDPMHVLLDLRAPQTITPERVSLVEGELAEHLGLAPDEIRLDVGLLILVQPQTSLRETILDYMTSKVPNTEVLQLFIAERPDLLPEDMQYTPDQPVPISLNMTLRTARTITADMVTTWRDELSERLERQVTLEIVVESIISPIEASEEPTPDATATPPS